MAVAATAERRMTARVLAAIGQLYSRLLFGLAVFSLSLSLSLSDIYIISLAIAQWQSEKASIACGNLFTLVQNSMAAFCFVFYVML